MARFKCKPGPFRNYVWGNESYKKNSYFNLTPNSQLFVYKSSIQLLNIILTNYTPEWDSYIDAKISGRLDQNWVTSKAFWAAPNLNLGRWVEMKNNVRKKKIK